jgi:hypothetical protein
MDVQRRNQRGDLREIETHFTADIDPHDISSRKMEAGPDRVYSARPDLFVH